MFVLSNDDIFFVDVDSDVVTFFNDDMDRNTINLSELLTLMTVVLMKLILK